MSAFCSTLLLGLGCANDSPAPAATQTTSRAVVAARPGRTHVNSLGEEAEGKSRPDFARYQNVAFPNAEIGVAESRGARQAWRGVGADEHDSCGGRMDWALVTPEVNKTPSIVTYTGRETTVSGRVTALALSPGCGNTRAGECRLWLGAAGGGVWRTDNPTAAKPRWELASTGLDSTAIGSIAVDPNGRGRVLYAGTGEQNLSGDSEAGVGLYKSTDGGEHWKVLPATVPFSEGAAIGAIAIDPRDPMHFYFGTSAAVHGSGASSSASRPPDRPALGLFETRDGGKTVQPVLQFEGLPPEYPAVFGGVTQIEFDPNDPNTIYFPLTGIGVARLSLTPKGLALDQVFQTADPNDGYNRIVIAVTKLGNNTRIYLGDSVDYTSESFVYRVDNARVPAEQLFDGASNVGWTMLSNPDPASAGFGSYNFCQGQCFYDIFIATPPGQPDTVWIGGSMNYEEIFGELQPSNGRAVMRSTNAGLQFTDMTNDARSPALGMHPDQHAIVFLPSNPGVAFIGSDGGLVRTDGRFVSRSADCDSRGLEGADLVQCRRWLASIPNRIDSLNEGLTTLQFQSVSLDPKKPRSRWIGGTQDNGTWSYGPGHQWFESIGGDGGQSGFDAVNSNIAIHSYYGPYIDVNFRGTDSLGWNWISDPLALSGENAAFYPPIITDPRVGGSMFVGMQRVWRTQDNGGSKAYLEEHCNEYTGDFAVECGNWVPLGGALLTSSNLVAVVRSAADRGTLWTASRGGTMYVTHNADAADASTVAFRRIDSTATPRRGVSGVAIDPLNGDHAWVSYTGYGAYTPSTPGHVFEMRVPAGTGPAVATDISYNLGDMPATALVRDDRTGDLYAGTDFGVVRLRAGTTTWRAAGTNLPPVAVYGLSISVGKRLLYAATHGRSVWRAELGGGDEPDDHDDRDE